MCMRGMGRDICWACVVWCGVGIFGYIRGREEERDVTVLGSGLMGYSLFRPYAKQKGSRSEVFQPPDVFPSLVTAFSKMNPAECNAA